MSRNRGREEGRLSDRPVLTPSAAAKLLPRRRETALEWLRTEGLIREHGTLGELVVVSELEDRLRGVRPPAQRPVRRLAERREGDAL
jgi:hypothetical protein